MSEGELILKQRRMHYITSKQLAKEASVTASVIQDLELEKVDPWDVMVDVLKICRALVDKDDWRSYED